MSRLKKFSKNDLKISKADAAAIFCFFWANKPIQPTQVNDTDRSFAQALIVEAIDASADMMWIEALFRSTAKPNTSVTKAIKSFVVNAAKQWFKQADKEDIMNYKIYESVRATLSRNFRSEWQMRLATGRYVGY